MKKLALALVCLVSVAFFASCDPENIIQNPEPSIATIVADGYLYDGQIVEADQMYPYGFRVASNAQTQKELSKLLITCNGQTLCDTAISGTEFTYRGEIAFYPNKDGREIVGEAEILATVTDVAGKQNFASITVAVNKEETLEVTDLEWIRTGNVVEEATATKMAILGLQWTGSYRDIMATIKPLTDAKLYVLDESVFETVNTETELAVLFSDLLENGTPVESYRNISATASADYHDVLAVITEDGSPYLIHITHAKIENLGSFGTKITITGQFK